LPVLLPLPELPLDLTFGQNFLKCSSEPHSVHVMILPSAPRGFVRFV
jgi:hypothetical protein